MIWLDAHVSPRLAKFLSESLGLETAALRDILDGQVSLLSADDESIYQAARKQRAVFITKDSDLVESVNRLFYLIDYSLPAMTRFLYLFLACLLWSSVQAVAQTLPSGTINVPGTYSTIGDDESIGSHTTLNVTGGRIGKDFSVGTTFGPNNSTIANISGGVIKRPFIVRRNAVANISGGDFEGLVAVASGGTANISGGSLGNFFSASSGSEVDVSGGKFSRAFRARAGSQVTLLGGEFQVNGTPTTSTVTLGDEDYLSGTLEDGSTFIFSPLALGDIQNVSLVNRTLPQVDLTPITVNSNNGPQGLRAGQSLTLVDGGELAEDFAALGAVLNISGGTVHSGLETADSTVNITGGTVRALMHLYAGSVVTISGDAVVDSIYAYKDSEVNIYGGTVSDFTRAEAGSRFNILGGNVGRFFGVMTGGEAHIAGGVFGSNFEQEVNSTVAFYGGDFLLNGAPVSGSATMAVQSTDTLTGTFADGTPFLFSWAQFDQLREVTLINEPPAPADTTPITLNTGVGPNGLRPGQSLSLDGGSLPNDFTALGATIDVSGGTIGDGFAAATSTIHITDGNIGEFMAVFQNSKVDVSGGTIGAGVSAYSNSIINISGGSVGGTDDSGVAAYEGSIINITAGTVGAYVGVGDGGHINVAGGDVASLVFGVFDGGVAKISGGSLGQSFDAYSGSKAIISGGTLSPDFDATTGSEVLLLGSQFVLDGVDITNTLIAGTPMEIDVRDVTLSGILADGMPFSFDLNSSGSYFSSVFSPGALLTVALPAPGDFDLDGDVDGADFLTWQREPITQSLADWEANYGVNSGLATPSSAAVPEPGALLLIALSCSCGLIFERRRAAMLGD